MNTGDSLFVQLLVAVLFVCVCAVGCAGRPGAQAVAPAPASAEAELTAEQLLMIAEAAEHSGDAVRAQQYLLAAAAHGADEDRVMPRLLRLYIRDRQFRLAIEHAENALRKRPGHRPLRFVLASLYRAVGRENDADVQYQGLLRDDPQDAQAHYDLGTMLHDAGHELGRADLHLREYLTLRPAGPYAVQARSLLLAEVP